MAHLEIKNWSEFQHYKDRNPPWIKLHSRLLNDYDFSCLQDASKAQLMLLWLLAGQLDNRIPDDREWIKKRLGLTSDFKLELLIEKGFLVRYQDASMELADCSPETEAEAETETKKKKEKIGINELSLEHVAEWLAKKHVQGIYTDIDENLLLEKFKDYCLSKGNTYKDYVAAFRNAFLWKDAPKRKGLHNETTKPSGYGADKADRAKEAIMRGLAT